MNSNSKKDTGISADSVVHLSQVIADVERELSVTLTLHDRQGTFWRVGGQPLWSLCYRHRHGYCEMDRAKRRGWDRNCMEHCLTQVRERVATDPRPFVTHCWKGTREVVVPLMRNGTHLATLFAGTFRADDVVCAGTLKVKGMSAQMREMYLALPLLAAERAAMIGRILTVFGQGLLSEVERLHQFGGGGIEPSRKEAILRFIHHRAHAAVTLTDLAQTLYLSPSRTSHLVKELFGESFQEILIRERIERAKTLLVASRQTVQEIARQVGLPNAYYFNRLFKQRVGMPPGRYRRETAVRK